MTKLLNYIKKHLITSIIAITLSSSVLGGVVNLSGAILDIEIKFDMDWIGIFDSFCAKEYNDKYADAENYLSTGEYLEAYKLLKKTEIGLKYDVSYTQDNINENIDKCIVMYTDKKIKACDTYLFGGEKEKILFDGIDVNADIVAKDKKDLLANKLKLVVIADKFIEKNEKGEYFEALELYSREGLDNYLIEILNQVVDNCEENAQDKVSNLISKKRYNDADNIYKLLQKYSDNSKLLSDLKVTIEGNKKYDEISKLFEEEKYLDLIKNVNSDPSLLNHQEIKNLYDQSSYKYIDNIREKVTKLDENNKFDELKMEIDNALRLVKSEDLTNLKEKYANYNNKELWYYHCVDNNAKKEEEKYINNNIFFKLFYLYTNNSLVFKNDHRNLTGHCFINKDEWNDENISVELHIFGDNNLLKKIELNVANYECTFNENINGYKTLNFSVVCNDSNNARVYLNDLCVNN